ncbi:MAG: SpoIID/LytB domain-containing protein [Clostridia bacterium]|nr:SpoIID/LytB domain-containing protein [Clostridia bacterium]
MGKKPVKGDATTQTWVKIVCGIMGFLMVFGVLVMLISSLQTAAVESNQSQTVPDQQISVGLYCNENAVQSYALSAEHGVQIAVAPSGLTVSLDSQNVIVSVDGNLYRVGSELSTTSGGIATVGGYHIEISYFTFSDLGIDTDHDNPVFIRPGSTAGSTDGYSPANVYDYISLLSDDTTFQALSLPAFPCYVSGQKCYIRVGNFFTKEEAEEALAQLQRTMTLNASIAEPDADSVTVLARDYTVLCEFTGKNQSYQITPTDDGVIRGADGRAFCGTISMASVKDSSRKGINVINQLSLEAYIGALLPSEVSSEWDSELLKSMAVLLRTEITRKLGCHDADGFDICAESHCHTYIGRATATDRVLDAVQATAGQILTYDGAPIYTPYAMTNGNGTVSAKDAFGKEVPYLPAIYTPWEEQSSWSVEFTPFELYQLLSNAGYREITGNVASVQVNAWAEGSDYVTSITFTDLFGGSVTVEGSETIRLLFSGRLPSSCFVVGLAGESVEYTKRTLSGNATEYSESKETVVLAGTYGSFVFMGSGSGCGVGFSVMGAKALAERGFNYRQILNIYFPGAELPDSVGTE